MLGIDGRLKAVVCAVAANTLEELEKPEEEEAEEI